MTYSEVAIRTAHEILDRLGVGGPACTDERGHSDECQACCEAYERGVQEGFDSARYED